MKKTTLATILGVSTLAGGIFFGSKFMTPVLAKTFDGSLTSSISTPSADTSVDLHTTGKIVPSTEVTPEKVETHTAASADTTTSGDPASPEVDSSVDTSVKTDVSIDVPKVLEITEPDSQR